MKQKLKCSDEWDCVSNYWRSMIDIQWKKVKRRLNKRYRKESKQEIKQQLNDMEEIET